MKSLSKKIPYISIVMWMIFVGLHIWIRIVSYEKPQESLFYTGAAVLVLVMTILGMVVIKNVDYLVERMSESSERFKYKEVIVDLILCLMPCAVVFEFYGDNFSLCFYSKIEIGFLMIPKSHVFYFYTILLFPWLIDLIFRRTERKDFSKEILFSVILKSTGIIFWGFLVFESMSNIWLLYLMITEAVIIAYAVYKYLWKKDLSEKTKRMAIVTGGVVLFFSLFTLFDEIRYTFLDYFYSDEWAEYKAGVRMLMDKACLWGTSQELLEMESINLFLTDECNYIHQLFAYGGWIAVIAFIIFLFGFMIVLYKMPGVRNETYKSFLLYRAAYWILMTRTIVGIFWSFAIIPYPLNHPFAADWGIITDTMALGLLLFCAYETYKIEEIKKRDLISAEQVLGKADSYEVLLEEEVYNEKTAISFVGSIYKDDVKIGRGENGKWYQAELYKREDVVCAIFSLEKEKQVFVLQYVDEQWRIPQGELASEVYYEYLDSKMEMYASGMERDSLFE